MTTCYMITFHCLGAKFEKFENEVRIAKCIQQFYLIFVYNKFRKISRSTVHKYCTEILLRFL